MKKGRRLPWQVWLVAGLVALINLAPILWAQVSTPQGWTFTGSLSNSPDVMQYRTWLRQTQVEGVLVTNKFTAEPNQPHLLLVFYYLVGRLAELSGIAPEYVYALSGALFVFLFTILLFWLVNAFMPNVRQTWTVFLLILIAGGLDVHLLMLSNLQFVRETPLLFNTLVKGVWDWVPLVDLRGGYTFRAILETHYALNWLLMTLSLTLIYQALKTSRPGWLALAIASASLTTLLHVYEGVTLLAIVAALAVLAGIKKQLNRQVSLTLGAVSLAVLASLTALLAWQIGSGLPLPDWRGDVVLFSTLLLAYPLAWVMLAIGMGDYWRKAGLAEVFLLGWAVGCLLVTLSSPFYPYPFRGTLTLQIPLFIVAGQIYFARWPRLTWQVLVVIILVGLLLPARELKNLADNASFQPNRPEVYLDANHLAIVQAVEQNSQAQDVLLVNLARPGWQNDLLWLGPRYPGRFYCGHFFLCVDYEKKRQAVIAFYEADPVKQQAFLKENAIDLLFAAPDEHPERIASLPGMQSIIANEAGTLFRYSP